MIFLIKCFRYGNKLEFNEIFCFCDFCCYNASFDVYQLKYSGGRRANRTHNLSLRTGLLYPIELGNQYLDNNTYIKKSQVMASN